MELRRTEFSICAMSANTVRLQALLESLQVAGYTVILKSDFESFLEMVKIEPPHFVLFDFEDCETELIEWSAKLKKISNEIKVILAVPVAKRLHAIHCKQIKLVDDYILSPWMSDGEVIDTFDRCAMIASYQFENEHLKSLIAEQEQAASPVAEEITPIGLKGFSFVGDSATPNASPEDIALELLEEMEFCQSSDQIIDRFLAHASPSPCLFLRYIATRRHLIAQSTQGLIRSQTLGLGVEITKESEEILLQNSVHIPELEKLLHEGLNWHRFGAKMVQINGRIEGVFVCEDKNQMPSNLVWQIFRQSLTGQRAADQVKKLNFKDEKTGFWSSSYLHECLNAEVTRSRRINLPTSLLIIELDQETNNNSFRKITKALEKTSRVNDILISLPQSQIGVVLPHTPLQGAAVKAERFRRIVEALGQGCTVSVGVSEYPRCATDGESLLQTADDALSAVRELGRNSVCMAMDIQDLQSEKMVQP